MCLAVPAEIKEINGDVAKVDFGGVLKDVNVSLVDANIGEYVIVHAGFAIEKLNKEEAERSLDIFKQMLELEEEDA